MGYPDDYGVGFLGRPVDPTTGFLNGATAALLPLMGSSRMPTGGIGAALAALGVGGAQGMADAQRANLAARVQALQAQGLTNANDLSGMQVRYYRNAQANRFGSGAPTAAAATAQAMSPDPSALDTQAAALPPPLTTQNGMSVGGGAQGLLDPSYAPTWAGNAPVRANGTPVASPTSEVGPHMYGQPAPLFNATDLQRQYLDAAATPGMTPLAQGLLSLIEKGVPEGGYIGVDNGVYARPGYNQFLQGKSAADAAGAAPYKALEALMGQAGRAVKLEPGDNVTTGFSTLPPQIQAAIGSVLQGTNPRGGPQIQPSQNPGGGFAPSAAGGGFAPPSAAGGGPRVDPTGFPTQSIYGQQGTLQSPLTLEGKALQTTVLPEAFKAAKQQYDAGNAMSGQLDMMDRAIEQLNQSGWSSTGAGANLKLGAIKGINSLQSTLGLSPSFDPTKIATWEDFNKESTRMGFELAKTLGSREAMMIVQQAVGAVPNAENTYLGARLVSSSLRQASARQIDHYEYLNSYAMSHGGNTMGADIAFNKANPPALYAQRAVANAIPPQAVDYLRQNPKTGAQFDQTFGPGMANFILKQK